MGKTGRWKRLEEESHEAHLPHVLPMSYSWGQKDQERSTAFSDYRGRKRLPSRLSGCITRGRGQEKKPRTKAREAKSSEAQLQGMGVMRQEAGEIRTGGAKGKASELTEFKTEIPNNVRVQGDRSQTSACFAASVYM